jgi:hypothetical protein
MKKSLTKSLSLVILLFSITFLTNAQSISIPSAYILDAPLNTVENNGAGFASFTFVESSGMAVSEKANGLPNIKINVELDLLALTNFDTNLISGSLLDYFSVSYNTTESSILFIQNAKIPGDWFGVVNFPVSVTQNSSSEEALNGYHVNITTVDESIYSLGNANIHTYTRAVLATDSNAILNEVTIYPIPTDDILHIDNIITEDLNVTVYDSKGSLIFEDKFNEQANSISLKEFARGIYHLKIVNPISKKYKNVQFILN